MAERDIHVVLVLEIEKYPALYNFKLAEYSRKDVTERIWSEISNKTHLSVNDCKEKWRNIRSTFLRSLKTPASGSKPKKPYYLKDYLSFILPYVKPNNESRNCGNIPPIEPSDPEVEEQQEQDQRPATASNSQYNIQSEDSTLEEPAATLGKPEAVRRRRYNEVDSAMVKYLKKKIEKSGEPKQTTRTTNQIKMNHFFLSLLSEFDDMTDNQIRTFKIKVLQLIDEIKQGGQLPTPSAFIESLPSTSRDSFPSTSRESSTSSPRESRYPQQQSVPQYSPISSIATPSQNYDAHLTFDNNNSTQNEAIHNTPSPVHMPYDLSACNNNNNIDLSYEEL